MFYLTFNDVTVAFDTCLSSDATMEVESLLKKRFSTCFSPTNAETPFRTQRKLAHASITIRPVSELKINPGNVPRTFSWKRSQLLWGHLDESFYLTDGKSLAKLAYGAISQADIYLHEDTLKDKEFVSRTFLLIPILELLRDFDLHYIHGALIQRDDFGILLIGPGGTGKSTLSSIFVKNGWKWVSDDNLLLAANPEPFLLPFERELSLYPRSAEYLGMADVGVLEKSKYRIPHTSLQNCMLSRSSYPKIIVDLGGCTSDFETISKARILQRLLEENPVAWISKNHMQKSLTAYRELLHMCKSTISIKTDFQNPLATVDKILNPLTLSATDVYSLR